ncbi:MAG: hypothetical protein WCC05_16855 [Candidatus Sulfotelmatobacter sp.]
MATVPATPIKPRREMIEVKAPEQFQFTKLGQTAEGVLISIEPALVKGKEALEYLFQAEGGGRFTCLGTNDLNKKLHPGMIGHTVEIRYESDDASFQKPGQNAMKVFKVRVSREKEPGF